MRKHLGVVAWKWGDAYSPDHVNKFAAMVKRNLTIPYTFFCLTDRYQQDVYDLDLDLITAVPMANKQSAAWNHRANRRVEILSHRLRERLDVNRVLQLDLDLVILQNIDTLCQGWQTPMAQYWHPGASYNPSFMLLPDPRDDRPVKAPDYLGGAISASPADYLDACWQAFDTDPAGTFKRALWAGWSKGCSDQAIINWWLNGTSNTKSSVLCAELDHRHGLYAYKRMSELQRVHPPIQARIVFFTGAIAQKAMRSGQHLWVKEALR